MATLNVKGFTAILQGAATAVQAAAAGLVDFTIGSILRAMAEAQSQVVLWLQGLILQLLATIRAATSVGPDLDTWMADFGLTRLPAVAALGSVTFTRQTPTGTALVPIGSTVQSADLSQTYAVIVDTTNAAYNAPLGGYLMAASVATVTVPVQAVTAGSAGNAVAGAVTVISAAMPGVDTVTNALAFGGGADAESDAAFRLRFINYLGSLSEGTKAAITYAVTSLQAGASAYVVENQTYAGATQLGYFYVVVDDGTGTPSSSFLAQAAAAINAVRGLTIQFNVYAPVVVTANVGMVLAVATGYVKASVAAAVQAALTAYINSLTEGQTLNYTKLAQIAYEASPGVSNVTSVTLNSGTSDLTATAKQVIKAGTITPTAP